MTGKTSKATVKTLQIELNNIKEELTTVKTELDDVKNELAEVKENQRKVANMEEAIEETNTENERNFKKCKICDNSFKLKREFLLHLKENHPIKVKCKSCEEIFDKNSDLEEHIRTKHEQVETYKCEKCDKTFVLKWRLNKHQDMHVSSTTKKCHYFNNNKPFPYEKIGCMFDHVVSDRCIFGKTCSSNLCSYQHENEKEHSLEALEKELSDKFNELTKEEQYESRMVLCDKLCKPTHGYHRCDNQTYEGYVGCDVFNVTYEFEDDCNSNELFPCEECDKVFEEYEKAFLA